MKKFRLFTLFIFLAFLCCSSKIYSQVLTDFYSYTLNGSSYSVGLNTDFQAQLNLASGGSFIDSGGFTWVTGDALPNPDPNGMYNDLPVTDMSYMFSNCNYLTSINLSNFSTSNVTDMSDMFFNCNNLTSINLSNFSTSNVTNMNEMFSNCQALESLDLSGFSTSNVTDMGSMFQSCSALKSIDLSSLNTANVLDMISMFLNCNNLTSLDLSKFNTASVTSMISMFNGCSGLTSLDLSKFNTASVTSISQMFSGCSSLKSINLSSLNTANVTDMSYMFDGCSGLTSLDLSNFNTANVSDMSYMFDGCSGLTSLDLSSLNTANVSDMSSMFDGCSGLISLDLSNFNTANVTDMSYMFSGCGQADGSGQAAIGIAKDWAMANTLNNASTTSITATKLRFGIANESDKLNYVLFQNADASGKCATFMHPSSGNTYSGIVTIVDNVDVVSDSYPVTAIAPYALYGCTGITEVKVSKNATKVGDYSFTGTPTNIVLNMNPNTPPTVTDLAFDAGHYTSATLRVHDVAQTAYKAHAVWGKFINMPTGVDGVSKDMSLQVIRTADGLKVMGIEAGNIVTLYTTSGALLRSVNVADTSVEIGGIDPGIYIVKSGTKTVKVVR